VNPVTVVEGRMVPLDRADVDTDQIMPKQFLKRIERTGFGDLVFHDWRADGDFVLDDPRYAGARVLVTGPNFGCGSSREHAPWGLQQFGFEAVIAPSFADIFRTNCGKIGLLAIPLPEPQVRALLDLALHDPQAPVRIDLPEQRVVTAAGNWGFEFDPHTKHMLTAGLDEIGATLQHDADIAAFERRRPSWLPTTVA
jgi:3-isopropylmalate/(R)-2-methylmalate dehydratase small subunit